MFRLLSAPDRSCYTASKHAAQGFFDSLRAEVAASKVKVSVINPGYIATNLSLNAVTGTGSVYGGKMGISYWRTVSCTTYRNFQWWLGEGCRLRFNQRQVFYC